MKSNILTSSRMSDARACARREYIKYELGYRGRTDSNALYFGSMLHLMLEEWWSEPLPALRLSKALYAIRDIDIRDEFERAKLIALMAGYDSMYECQLIETSHDEGRPAVEVQFETNLMNPLTNMPSRTWRLAGKLDAIGVDLAEAYPLPEVVEHKSSASNIGPGSDYWARLCMDSQVSIYFDGAAALGVQAAAVLYDVIGKPTIRPHKATPAEARKYIQKGPEEGRLYKGQREEDETPDEYGARLAADIAAAPEEYFRRGKVVRLEHELFEARLDLWSTAKRTNEFYKAKYWPKNPDSCLSYGALCQFFGVCTRTQSLEDESLFVKLDNPHLELDLEVVS